jgi:hypothetical protein
MTHATFDTLIFVNKLKVAGMETALAETLASSIQDILGGFMDSEQMATKQDLLTLEIKLSGLFTRMTISSVSLIIGLQSLLHFVK